MAQPIGNTSGLRELVGNPIENSYANSRGAFIEFVHVPTGKSVFFKSFLENISDNWKSDWNHETVFGRSDPISTFQATSRSITVAWAIPSSDETEGKRNLAKVSLLVSMLYPTYELNYGANTISSSPLMRVKFANLIQDVSTGLGLVCAIDGFNLQPENNIGYYEEYA
jgi:hypothetical protein